MFGNRIEHRTSNIEHRRPKCPHPPLSRNTGRGKGEVSRALAFAAAATLCSAAFAQLRIVQYNTGEVKPGLSTVLEQIGNEQVNGIARPIDVLVVEEQGDMEISEAFADLTALRDAMNAIYGAGAYAATPYPAAADSDGGGLPGVVYRVASVDLIGLVQAVGIADPTHNARTTIRYQFRPDGYSTADFYLYASHMKASPGGTNDDRRNEEAISNRANADALGEGTHIIYAGDLNLYSTGEMAYATLTAAGAGQAVDPQGSSNWTGDTNRIRHTQAPTFSGPGGLVGGGMDDRFDFQLSTGEFHDNEGLALIANSYRHFGNNGTHPYEGDINHASNTWNSPGLTVSASTVLNALMTATDHIPVVADYQIPAKLSVSVASVPSQVIRDGAVTVGVTVSNSAPALAANGADELDYTVSGTAFTGSTNGMDAALGGSNLHNMSLNTATLGVNNRNVSVTTSSQGAAGGPFNQNVNYTVLDKSQASFNGASDINNLTIDFSYVPYGFTPRTANFSVHNLVGAGTTAALDMDSVNGIGDTSRLTTNLPANFSNLPAGSQNNYTATAQTGTVGSNPATYTLAVSDQNLPGATSGASLVLTLQSHVFQDAIFPVTGTLDLLTGETLNTGPFQIGPGVTLTRTGPGTLNITGTQSNGEGSVLTLSDGETNIQTDGGTDLTINANSITNLTATQHLAGLSIGSGKTTKLIGSDIALRTASLTVNGTLDLTTNDLIVDGADYLTIEALVIDGFNNGDWLGEGITSSSAASDTNFVTALGIADNANVGYEEFAGFTDLDGDEILVKHTYYGDADLGGTVNLDDFNQFLFGFNNGDGGPPAIWLNGDFDYNGSINLDDFNQFLFGLQSQGGALVSPELFAALSEFAMSEDLDVDLSTVPEPAALVFLALGSMLLSRRRSR